MDKNLNLIVYKNKGRPNKEEKKVMTSPTLLKKELKRLKTEMKYKGGTKIVLLFSIASDEMIKVVHMNPEVMYIDVTAKTNRQKRDLFLMVVKSVCGSSFIGNANLPSVW